MITPRIGELARKARDVVTDVLLLSGLIGLPIVRILDFSSPEIKKYAVVYFGGLLFLWGSTGIAGREIILGSKKIKVFKGNEAVAIGLLMIFIASVIGYLAWKQSST